MPERYIPRHNASEDHLPEDYMPKRSDREKDDSQRGGGSRPVQRLPRVFLATFWHLGGNRV